VPRLLPLHLAVGLLLGVASGVGGYTFVYARGASYLTDRPEACANCHVMQPYLDGWTTASHRSAAVCNDCHTPAGFVRKYAVKAENGFWHSYAFTTGDFHEPLRMKERNRRVTEAACRKCHAALTFAIEGPHRPGQEVRCLRCHREVGHR
jgi:cytochrome c nitrite reductase small subunit